MLTHAHRAAGYVSTAIRGVRHAEGARSRREETARDLKEDLMNNRAIRAASSDLPPLPAGVEGAGDPSSFLVDSAISHAEKLRKVLQLEEWINGTPDTPMFAATRRRWQEQRKRLLGELQL
jgi:hypothetical protein